MELHKEKNVFLISSLKSYREPLDENESWLISQLGGILFKSQNDDEQNPIAESLFNLLINSKSFQKITRLCLVKTTPGTRLLEVVDVKSTFKDSNHENLMKKGYRCFVSKNSSLFSIPPGTTRVFSNIENVLGSFKEQNKPVQRSIRLISEMNCKSGIVLPLHSNKDVIGFLFLNSDEPEYFNNITGPSAQLLSALYMFANSYLSAFRGFAGETCTQISTLPISSLDNKSLTVFLENELQGTFGRTIKITCTSDDYGVFAAKNLSSFLLQLMIATISDESTLEIKIENGTNDRKKISILGYKNQFFSEGFAQIFILLAHSYGLEFEWTKGNNPSVMAYFELNHSGTSDLYSV